MKGNKIAMIISMLALSTSMVQAFPKGNNSVSKSVTDAVFEVELMDLSKNKSIGTIVGENTKYGLVLTPNLKGISPGQHGFHIHENPSCEPSTNAKGVTVIGGAAGGHLDTGNTKKHGTPWGEDNHIGDMPPLFADAKGRVTGAVLAPRLTVEMVKNRSIMVHLGGDNFSDSPAPLGGGGKRVACGVIR